MQHRIFIAINLPQEIKKELSSLVEDLEKKNRHLPIKWVEADNFHITLHFLGSLNDEQIKQVDGILQRCVNGMALAEFELTDLDGFPNIHSARVVFLDSRELNGAKIFNLQKKIGQELAKMGLEIDSRPWRSHITLGRNKNGGKVNLVKHNLTGLKFIVNSVEMMESQLSSTGPEYSVVKSFKFI